MNNSQENSQLQQVGSKFKKTTKVNSNNKSKNRTFGTILNINLKLGFRSPGIIATGVIFAVISTILAFVSIGLYSSVSTTSFTFLIFDIFVTFLLGLLITLSGHYYFRKQITEGIHNIELRGGVNSLTSFWMRLLCQQIIVLTYISIYVAISMIFVSTNNSIELPEFKTRFYIWIVFIYFINIFITAIVLFIFSFSSSAIGVLLSVFVTILFSLTNAVSVIVSTILTGVRDSQQPATLSPVSAINLNAQFGKKIYEEFKDDKDIGYLFTDGDGYNLFDKLDVKSPSDFHEGNEKSIAKDVLLSGLVYDSETITSSNYAFEDEKDPNKPNISADGEIKDAPKISNTKIYNAIFKKILDSVNHNKYKSRFNGETDVLMYNSNNYGNEEKHKVVADDIINYLLNKPELKELNHLLSFIKENLNTFEIFTRSDMFSGGYNLVKSVMPYLKIEQSYNTNNQPFGKNSDFYKTMPDLLLLNFYIMSVWKMGMFLDTTMYLPDFINVGNEGSQKKPYDKLENLKSIQKASKSKSIIPTNHFNLMRTSSNPEVNAYYDNATTLGTLSMASDINVGLDFEDTNEAFVNAMSLKSLPYELLLSKSKVTLSLKGQSDTIEITNYKELKEDGHEITFDGSDISDDKDSGDSFLREFDDKNGIITITALEDQTSYQRYAYLDVLIDKNNLGEVGRIEVYQPKLETKSVKNLQTNQSKVSKIPSFEKQVQNSIYKTYNPKVINYYSQTLEYIVYSVLLVSLAWIAFFVYKKKSKI